MFTCWHDSSGVRRPNVLIPSLGVGIFCFVLHMFYSHKHYIKLCVNTPVIELKFLKNYLAVLSGQEMRVTQVSDIPYNSFFLFTGILILRVLVLM
jgi:hypothetical protein